jgi:ABC-2 type transport system permease protein
MKAPMLTVDLTAQLRRPRTWLLTALTLLLPALFLAALSGRGRPSTTTTDPVAYLAALRHGWQVVQDPLLLGSPVFLPVVVAVIGGTALGADSASGYLRYLLLSPTSRTRLYLTRLATSATLCLMLTTALLAIGTIAALLLPHPDGLQPVTLAPGGAITPVSATGYAFRLLLAAAYLTLWLSALASIGLLAGLATRSAVGGVGIAIGYHLVATVLTQVSFLQQIRPALLPYWLGRWTTLATTHPHWPAITGGLGCAILYLILTSLAGIAIFTRQDITS